MLEDLNKTKILNDQIAKEMERIDEQVKTLGIEQAQIKRDRLHAEEKHANDILLIAEERQELSEIINQKEMIEKASDRVAINVEKEEYFSNCFECVLEEQARLDKESKKIGFDISTLEATHAKLENNSDIAELTASIDTGNVKLRTAKDKQASLLLNRRQVENDHEITDIETKIARCKKDIELAIDPACESKICPALLLVADAKKELPALEDALKSKAAINQSKILEIDTSLKIIDAKIIVTKANIETLEAEKKETDTLLDKQLKKISDEIDEKRKSARAITSKFLQSDDAKIFYRDSRNECRRNINEAKSFAEKLSELKVAESKKESLGSQEKEKIAGWLELKQEFDEKFGAKVLTIAELNDKSLFIDEKINVTVNVDIMVCKKTITDKQKEIEELKGIESDNNMKIAVIEDCKKQKEELYLSLKDNQAFKTAVGKEILDWTYLRDACSKTGLQALEIDGAAPLITREANTLLETTFGLDFQIKIVTQDPETGKEVFWVMVIRDDGSEDKFDKLSGGQKVWIAKALTLGMTLVSKDKSGKAFLTLFADEEDGALDPKRSIDFISLYRTMLQAGEFESCMYISHKPEIVAMADNILDFSGDTLSWE